MSATTASAGSILRKAVRGWNVKYSSITRPSGSSGRRLRWYQSRICSACTSAFSFQPVGGIGQAATVEAELESAADAGTLRGLDVPGAIADQCGRCQIQAQLLRGAQQHARLRLAAVAAID